MGTGLTLPNVLPLAIEMTLNVALATDEKTTIGMLRTKRNCVAVPVLRGWFCRQEILWAITAHMVFWLFGIAQAIATKILLPPAIAAAIPGTAEMARTLLCIALRPAVQILKFETWLWR